MGVACRHDDAEAVLKAFDGSSLDVQALDSRLHAVVRACQSILPQTGITAVLDLEWNGTMLLLVFEGTVFYKRTMSEGAVRQLVQAITEGLALDEEAALLLLAEVGLAPRGPEHASHAEAISPMISKYLDIMAHSLQSPLAYATAQYPGSSVAGLLLVGHGAGIPGVAEGLQQRLGMGVRAVTPADVVQGQPSLGAKAQDPSLVAAIGLARFACA
jgi:type IV pilus assembly protein PilM